MGDFYIGVNNVARKVKAVYIGVNNVARKVTDGYIGVGNIARRFYRSKLTATVGSLSQGDIFYVNEDGVAQPWQVIYKYGTYSLVSRLKNRYLLAPIIENIFLDRFIRYSESVVKTGLNQVYNSFDSSFLSNIVLQTRTYDYVYSNSGTLTIASEQIVNEGCFALKESELVGHFATPANRVRGLDGYDASTGWWHWKIAISGSTYYRYYIGYDGVETFKSATGNTSSDISTYNLPSMMLYNTAVVPIEP